MEKEKNEQGKRKSDSFKLRFPFESKIKNFAQKQPKKAFFIMIGIVAFALIYNIGGIIYKQKVVIPRYKENKKTNLIKGASNTLSTPFKAVDKISEIKKVLEELEYFRMKKELTKADSLRIEYLIDKYQKYGN